MAPVFFIGIGLFKPCPLIRDVMNGITKELCKFGIEIFEGLVISHNGEATGGVFNQNLELFLILPQIIFRLFLFGDVGKAFNQIVAPIDLDG